MDLKEQYILWLQKNPNLSENTKKTYARLMGRIDIDHLENSLLGIRDHLSDKTYNLVITVLRSFADFLELHYPEHSLIWRIRNLHSIRHPRSQPHEPYSPSEVRRILKHARGWLRMAVCLGLYAGLRRNEIRLLDLSHVDMKNRKITVWHGKGGKSRTIPISRPLQQELERWLAFRTSVPDGTDDKPLLITSRGTRPHLDSGTVLRGLSRASGIQVSWHRLRSTFATQLFRKTLDLKLVQSLLGHSSSVVTDRYIQRSFEELQQKIDRIGDIYE